MKLEEIKDKMNMIEGLDFIIIKTEKALTKLSKEKCDVDFKMTVTHEKEEGKPENVLDSDGSIKSEYLDGEPEPPSYQGIVFRSIFDREEKPKKKENEINLDHMFINEEVAIMVLSYMHKEYVAYRARLMKELERTGIKL